MDKILIGLHEFDGPVTTADLLPSEPGLLAVLIETSKGLELMDVLAATDIALLWDSICAHYLAYSKDGQIMLAHAIMPGLSSSERRRALEEINEEFDLAACA